MKFLSISLFITIILFSNSIVINGQTVFYDEFEGLKNTGDNYVYYLNSDNLISKDGEGTVDGVHLNESLSTYCIYPYEKNKYYHTINKKQLRNNIKSLSSQNN